MNRRHLLSLALLALLSLASCGGTQPRSYSAALTPDDSLSIAMGDWVLTKYHSDKLSLDIFHPSFLVRQDLPAEDGLQELFLWQDVSISVMVDSLSGLSRSTGQQMVGMGAELLDSGDDYSIHEGQDDEWEYYAKVIDSDSLREVTVILRYHPEHADAVEQLKEWVRDYEITPQK